MVIAHRIHQMWLDKHRDDAPIPDKYLSNPALCDSFKLHNPDYEYLTWNMEKVKTLFENEPTLAPWRTFFLHDVKFHIEKCDFARLAVVFVYGGVYADLDFYCHKRLDALLDDPVRSNGGIVWTLDIMNHTDETMWNIAYKWLTKQPEVNQVSVFNGFFAATSGNPILEQWMNYIMSHYSKDCIRMNVMHTTGPGAFGRFARENGYTIHERPDLYVDSRYILPYSSNGKLRDPCIEPYVSTKWNEGSSWGGDMALMIYQITMHVIFVLILIVFALYLARNVLHVIR